MSGTSGASLSMRTWQITGVRSANTLELSGRTTSELTRTSCGKPCEHDAEVAALELVADAVEDHHALRPAAGGMF